MSLSKDIQDHIKNLVKQEVTKLTTPKEQQEVIVVFENVDKESEEILMYFEPDTFPYTKECHIHAYSKASDGGYTYDFLAGGWLARRFLETIGGRRISHIISNNYKGKMYSLRPVGFKFTGVIYHLKQY
jgi:hypothetical protein